jgi:hypothetical protein
MNDKINPNIRSIIHILNNWNFTFDGSYVKANLEIHITKDELTAARKSLQDELDTKQKPVEGIVNLTDEEKREYLTAIADLDFAINELDKSYGSNQQ